MRNDEEHMNLYKFASGGFRRETFGLAGDRLTVAANAGFCFGIRRAVEMAEREAQKNAPCYTLGAITHNAQVVADLRARGVLCVDSADDIPADATVIIRAHGEGKAVHERLRAMGCAVRDATCPCVRAIHRRVEKAAGEGVPVFVVGAKDHPEVIGILGWADGLGLVVETEAQAELLPRCERALIVAQTTLPQPAFQAICEALKRRVCHPDIQNTTCSATQNRYDEARKIAAEVDVMLVVGGRGSANTRKLYELCRDICPRTHLIETADELRDLKIFPRDRIGVTAGASTPDGTYKEVVARMNDNENRDQILETGEVQEAQEELKQEAEVPAVEAEAPVADAEPVAEAVAEPAKEAEAEAPVGEPQAAEKEEPQSAESDFMADIERTLVQIRPGQTITGTVVQITPDEVCVNVGYKADGLIKKEDLTSENVQVGDEIEVEVVKVNDGEGNVLLSQRNIVNRKFWDEIVEKFEKGEYVDAIGKEAVKGGLIATVNGIRTFIPASQLSQRYVEKIEDFVGQEMSLKIIEIDKPKKRIVASRKAVLAAEEAERKKAIWGTLNVGSVVKGIVRRLTDFGAFVDVGGLDGLVHVTDLSWGRVRHPSDVVSVNQEIDVKILNVDPEKERISLSYKQTQPRPWDVAEMKYPIGSVVTGKVVRITTFGAFVELEPGLDGLVHISQCALTRINKVEDAVSVGQDVLVKVLDVNTEAKRISLSIRAVLEDQMPAYDEAPVDDGSEYALVSGEAYAFNDIDPIQEVAPVEEIAPVEAVAPAEEPAPAEEAAPAGEAEA